MNNKKLIASLLGVTVLTVGVSTYAYQGNPGVQNPNCTDLERQSAVTTMFENKDYSSFQELFGDRGIGRRITTEDQFLKFIELRQARLDGDMDKVEELREELGMGMGRMDGTGMKGQGRRGNSKRMGGGFMMNN